MEDQIPAHFCCPISFQLMEDPVVDVYGHTYDRASIMQWLSHNDTSPIDRNPLDASQLSPNFSLRDAIEEWKLAHPNYNNIVLPVNNSLRVNEALSVKTNGKELVTIDLKSLEKTSQDIVLCIDISASMNQEVISKRGTELVSDNLSRLDLVKQCGLLVVERLSESDTLAIVTFNQEAQTVVQFTQCNDAGKTKLRRLIKGIRHNGATNIKAALTLSNEIAAKGRRDALQQVILLTDGQDNRNPRNASADYIKQVMSDPASPNASTVVHTVGFTENVVSPELFAISRHGGGVFAFIPCAMNLCPVFVNVFTTCIMAAGKLIINDKPESTLLYHQTRRVVLQKPLAESSIILQRGQLRINLNLNPVVEDLSSEATFAHYRAEAVNKVEQLVEKHQVFGREKTLENLRKFIVNDPPADNEKCQTLYNDLTGEILLAVTKDEHFDCWMEAYYYHFASGHLAEKTTNFLDKSLQLYASLEEMVQEVTATEGLFNGLPAMEPNPNLSPAQQFMVRPQHPKRMMKSVCGGARARESQPQPRIRRTVGPTLSSTWNDRNAVCLLPHTLIDTVSGRMPASEVRAGQLLSNDLTVTHVVKSRTRSSCVDVGDGVIVTAWHPVFAAELGWVFPQDLVSRGMATNVDYEGPVYSFVLSTDLSVLTGLPCGKWVVASLGHKIEGPVIGHPFWGHQILHVLPMLPISDKGHLKMDPERLVRDSMGKIGGYIH